MTIIVLILIISCAPPTLTPTLTPEPEIPAHYTTYTSEGLFSISYPPDWTADTSTMGEIFEETKEVMKTTDPEVSLEGVSFLFMGGALVDESYYLAVGILVGPRSIGYWTLDEVIEAESQYDREHAQRYREYSQVRTVVDGREAVIKDSEDYDSDMGMQRYLSLFMVKDKFVWVVMCQTEAEHFKDYEDTFYSIVRSLRILE
jgi:hypothetical protein